MIIIAGESGSGKSTVQKALCDKMPELEKVITFTTRPMRDGEENGIDYFFITPEEFLEKAENGDFLETTNYRGWFYGTAKADITKYSVLVMNPAGFREAKRQGLDVTCFYLYVDKPSRMINMIRRGDDVDEVYRRATSDDGAFTGFEEEVDCVIANHEYRMSVEQVVDCIIEFLEDDNK